MPKDRGMERSEEKAENLPRDCVPTGTSDSEISELEEPGKTNVKTEKIQTQNIIQKQRQRRNQRQRQRHNRDRDGDRWRRLFTLQISSVSAHNLLVSLE